MNNKNHKMAAMCPKGSWILGATLLAASFLSVPANAADLGGNCCSDLEERIAELESTTARKGNRKVSLTISGWVNQSVMFWDNGVERNAYVLNNASSTSRLILSGSAKITPDVSAAYTLEIGVEGPANNTFVSENSARNAAPGPTGLTVRHSAWHLKSQTYGQLTVGQYDGASRYWVDFADYSRSFAVSNGVYSGFWNNGFNLITKTGKSSGLTWDAFGLDDLDIIRRNLIRYDTPTIAGFSAAVSWGEDDYYDAKLSWEGKLGDFKLAAVGMYQDWTQGFDGQYRCTQGGAGNNGAHCKTYGANAGFQHVPTGLFLSAAYANREHTNPTRDDSSFWRVKGGIKQKFNSLGETSIYGEYYKADSGLPAGKAIDASSGITTVKTSSMDVLGIGAVQWIDAAALELYVAYRHYSLDVKDAAGVEAGLKDFDAIQTGARIKF